VWIGLCGVTSGLHKPEILRRRGVERPASRVAAALFREIDETENFFAALRHGHGRRSNPC